MSLVSLPADVLRSILGWCSRREGRGARLACRALHRIAGSVQWHLPLACRVSCDTPPSIFSREKKNWTDAESIEKMTTVEMRYDEDDSLQDLLDRMHAIFVPRPRPLDLTDEQIRKAFREAALSFPPTRGRGVRWPHPDLRSPEADRDGEKALVVGKKSRLIPWVRSIHIMLHEQEIDFWTPLIPMGENGEFVQALWAKLEKMSAPGMSPPAGRQYWPFKTVSDPQQVTCLRRLESNWLAYGPETLVRTVLDDPSKTLLHASSFTFEEALEMQSEWP